MHAHSLTAQDLRIGKSSAWRRAPVVCGLVTLGALGTWSAQLAHEPGRALHAYLFGFVTVLSVALGCLAFVLLQHLTRAGWSVVVRRVAEIGMMSLPVLAVLFIPIALWQGELFPWTHPGDDQILQGKTPYLNTPFFSLRSVCYLAAWTFIALWFYRLSARQDDGQHPHDSLRMRCWSAPATAIFALSITFASFDWLMSLQPHWYSTIFGVLFFAGCVIMGVSFIILLCLMLQASGYLPCVNTEHYHDLGKLLFAFTIFWAYIAFSQFMLIWYAAIPEEAAFYYHRLRHGWAGVTWAMPVTHFLLPFFVLLSCHAKRNRFVLACAALWTLAMQALHTLWLVLPPLAEHAAATGHATAHALPNWLDAVALIGVAGACATMVTFLLTRKNLVAAGDPLLHESLAFENA
ncbi:MAG: hypothetical protein AAF471_05235 [Myxococcota bacterium]